MGRRPGNACSLCERPVSLKESRDDGNGGRRCKPSCPKKSDGVADAYATEVREHIAAE